MNNTPSPLSYDAQMPRSVLDEDAVVASHHLTVNADASRSVAADDLFT